MDQPVNEFLRKPGSNRATPEGQLHFLQTARKTRKMNGQTRSMTSPVPIQTVFLESIKQRLPPSISLADELAEALSISRDSAYRRIRGETVLSLDEAKALCVKYKVSLDTLLTPTPDMVSFQVRNVDHKNFTLHHWLASILGNLEMLASFAEREMFYSAKDVPIFYHFSSPQLAEFKIYFWEKVVLKYPHLSEVKFQAGVIPRETITLGSRVWDRFSTQPCTEIWSLETMHITMRQIEFCHECGYFEDPSSAVRMATLYLDLIRQIRRWTEQGAKPGNGSLTLYKNDILIADNTVYFKIGDKRVAFVTYNGMNILTTMQEHFCNQTEEYLKHLLSRAQLISTTGEKERNRFFNSMEVAIAEFIERLKKG
jgi:hypothetical protein